MTRVHRRERAVGYVSRGRNCDNPQKGRRANPIAAGPRVEDPMTLGLPGHLARDSLSRALAHAGHCAAWVCLGIGVAHRRARSDARRRPPRAGPARGSRVVLALSSLFVARYPTVTLTRGLPRGGHRCGARAHRDRDGLDLACSSRPTTSSWRSRAIALLLVGGAGAGSVIAITWATLGYALGEAAAFLGAALVGRGLDAERGHGPGLRHRGRGAHVRRTDSTLGLPPRDRTAPREPADP